MLVCVISEWLTRTTETTDNQQQQQQRNVINSFLTVLMVRVNVTQFLQNLDLYPALSKHTFTIRYRE